MSESSIDLTLSRLRRCKVWVGGNDLTREYVSLEGWRGSHREEFLFPAADLRTLLSDGRVICKASERLIENVNRYPATVRPITQYYWSAKP